MSLCEGLVVSLGSVATKSPGSQKAAWIWIQVPGVKQPAIAVTTMAATNFSAAYWPIVLGNMTLTLARFSMTTMA